MANRDTLVINTVQEIDGWGFTFEMVERQIRDYDGNRIIVPINSYGGDILTGIAIYNLLKGHRAKVTTRIVGYAMSMGTVIALAGDRVEMPENGYFMIHDPTGGGYGNSDDLKRIASVLDDMKSQIVNIYSNKTGLPKEEIEEMMARETWLNAEQALEMGFVDKLTKGVRMAASAKLPALLAESNFKNIPKELIQTTNMSKKNLFLNQINEAFNAVFGDQETPEGGANNSTSQKGDSKGDNTDDQSITKEDVQSMVNDARTAIEAEMSNAIGDAVNTLQSKVDAQQTAIDSVRAENASLKQKIATMKASNGQGAGDDNGGTPDGQGLEQEFKNKAMRATNKTKYGANASVEE